MVVPEQAVPPVLIQFLLPFCQAGFQLHQGKGRQIPFFLSLLLVQPDVLELEDHGEFAAIGIAVFPRDLRRGSPGLPHSDQSPLSGRSLGSAPSEIHGVSGRCS